MPIPFGILEEIWSVGMVAAASHRDDFSSSMTLWRRDMGSSAGDGANRGAFEGR
jgi:hypothetical protein